MTRDEAMQHVEGMMLGIQKFRSNAKDRDAWAEDPVGLEVYADLFPWMMDGPKCVLPTLIDIMMGEKPLTGQTFYNLMTIAHTLEPAIALAARAAYDRDLPAPNPQWCTVGW